MSDEGNYYTPPSEEELSRTFFGAGDMANKLKVRMNEAGETVESLAAKIGLGKRFVWDVLQGQERPETFGLLLLCEALGFTPEYIRESRPGPWETLLADAMSDEIPEVFEYIDPEPDAFRGNEQTRTFLENYEGGAPWL